MTVLTKPQIILLGFLALTGAAGGMIADVFSLWIPEPEILSRTDQHITVHFYDLLAQKTSSNLWLGSILGILLLPLHMCGFYLMAVALRPGGKLRASLFFALASFTAAIGSGFHGSIAFVGETALAGELDLFLQQMDLFIPWWWMLTSGFIIISILLIMLILTSPTLYPKSCILWTPGITAFILSIIVLTVNAVTQENGVTWFLMICGINLPLWIFHAVTTWVVFRKQTLAE